MSFDPRSAWASTYWEWIRQLYGPAYAQRLEHEFNSQLRDWITATQGIDFDDGPARTPNQNENSQNQNQDAWSIRPTAPLHDFTNLIVPQATLEALALALNKVIHADTIYEEFNMKSVDRRGKRTVLNFFGLPGTGKTFAAHCIAQRLGKTIIEADYSQIESKWIGETEKNLARIFDEARRSASVLFFDEADAMLGSRVNIHSGSDQHLNRTRSVMLIELEKFNGVVVFATNNIGNYDKAFARRIVAHVEFPLPDTENRRMLWHRLLPREVPRHAEVSDQWLGALSEGFAGGDILNAAWLMATAAAVKPKAERFVTTEDADRALASVRLGLNFVGKRPGPPGAI